MFAFGCIKPRSDNGTLLRERERGGGGGGRHIHTEREREREREYHSATSYLMVALCIKGSPPSTGVLSKIFRPSETHEPHRKQERSQHQQQQQQQSSNNQCTTSGEDSLHSSLCPLLSPYPSIIGVDRDRTSFASSSFDADATNPAPSAGAIGGGVPVLLVAAAPAFTVPGSDKHDGGGGVGEERRGEGDWGGSKSNNTFLAPR